MRLLQPFKDIAGVGELIVETDRRTIKSVLLAVAKTYPKLKSEFFDEKGMIKDYLNIMINERLVPSGARTIKLKANDELAIFIAVGGG
ncbi:MAG: MoaD/ThiS family protein [Candidatus Thermoplasmatota archaeon]|nr:MoaD/ThiS family protein [Candidatus Thermoplasmatota archaeon]